KSFFDLYKAMFEIGCLDIKDYTSDTLLKDVISNSGILNATQILEKLGPQIESIKISDIVVLDAAYRKHSNETLNDGGYGIKIILNSEVESFLEEFDEEVVDDIYNAFMSNANQNYSSFDIPQWCLDLTEQWKDSWIEDPSQAENYAEI